MGVGCGQNLVASVYDRIDIGAEKGVDWPSDKHAPRVPARCGAALASESTSS